MLLLTPVLECLFTMTGRYFSPDAGGSLPVMRGEIGSVAATALTAGMALGIVSHGASVVAWLVALQIGRAHV